MAAATDVPPEVNTNYAHGEPIVAGWRSRGRVWCFERDGATIDSRPGTCDRCGETCDGGPDPCLGLLPGVSHACCGHDHGIPYVIVGGEPNQSCQGRDDYEVLRGIEAEAFFWAHGRGRPGR